MKRVRLILRGEHRMSEIHPFYQAHRGAMEAAMRQRLDLAETMLRERAHLADLDKVRQEVMDEFEIVLTQMPYVGGAASRMSDFFMRLMGFMAIGRVLRRHGVPLPIIGDIERESYKAQLLTVPEAERLASGRQFMSRENQSLLREQAAKSLANEYPRILSTISSSQGRATALNSVSITRRAASASSPLVTAIRKSSHTFADLISRPTQRVAFVWNEPKRWLAAPATAIFASPASKQSRTCEAFASGRQRRFDRTTATFGLPPATDIVSAGRHGLFRATSRVSTCNDAHH